MRSDGEWWPREWWPPEGPGEYLARCEPAKALVGNPSWSGQCAAWVEAEERGRGLRQTTALYDQTLLLIGIRLQVRLDLTHLFP